MDKPPGGGKANRSRDKRHNKFNLHVGFTLTCDTEELCMSQEPSILSFHLINI